MGIGFVLEYITQHPASRIILVINITLDCVVVLLVPTEVIWCIVARCRCSCYVWAVDSTHNIR